MDPDLVLIQSLLIRCLKCSKRFYAEAGIDTTGRNISNHSGRVTCCTRLYNEGFSDKAVVSRRSHCSNAVHTYMYQREQFKILSDISNTLGAPAPKVENCPENVKFVSKILGVPAPKVDNCQKKPSSS